MEANNMAAMREALELAIDIHDWCCVETDDPIECSQCSCYYQKEPHGEAGEDCPWKKIRAALATPPRNCDVGTAEERMYRYNRHRDEINERYERLGEIPPSFAFPTAFEWEDRPYEAGEGGTK